MRRLHRMCVLRPAPASPATATLVSEGHGRGQRGRARGRESAPGHGGARATDCAGPRAHCWASTDRARPSSPPSSSSLRELCIRVPTHPSPLRSQRLVTVGGMKAKVGSRASDSRLVVKKSKAKRPPSAFIVFMVTVEGMLSFCYLSPDYGRPVSPAFDCYRRSSMVKNKTLVELVKYCRALHL